MAKKLHSRASSAAARLRYHLANALGREMTPAEAAWLWERLPAIRAGIDAPELGRQVQTYLGQCPCCGLISLLLLGADKFARCFDCWAVEREHGPIHGGEDGEG